MSENIEYIGYWYLPDKKQDELYGKLTINNNKIDLEVYGGLFDGVKDSINMKELDVINGFTICGKSITLLNNISLGFKMNMPGTMINKYRSKFMIIGNEYTSIDECILSSISCSYTNLSEWIGISGFNLEYEKNNICINYSCPDEIAYELDHYTLKINYRLKKTGSLLDEINMKQYINIVFEGLLDYNLDSALKIIYDFSRFLTLCIGQKISPYNIKAKDKNGKDVEIKINGVEEISDKKINNNEMLIPFNFIKDNFKDCLTNWNDKKEKLSPVIDYVVDSHSKVFHIPLSFIKLVQATETFSRRMRNNCKIDEDEHNSKIEYIISKIDNDEYKEWLIDRLRYSNEPSLSMRLKEIFKEVDFIISLNSGERKKIVKKIVDTRNYYTHFDESKKDLIMTTEELIYISKYILVILKVLIMKELGLDEASIEGQLKGLNEIIFIKAQLKKLFNITSLQ